MSATATEVIGILIDDQEADAVSGETFVSVDPSTGEDVARVALGGAIDVDRAVAAARRAYRDVWRDSIPAQRAAILSRIGPALRAASEDLVELAARDGGLPVSGVRGDIELAARYFDFYSGLAEKIGGTTIPLGPDYVDFTTREPWGVCGVIMPFNSPYQLLARSVAPALAAGNTVVVKTAEQAPVGPALLMRVALEAGLPPGLVQLVPGGGEAGAHLAGHPDIDRLIFTGSGPTAQCVLTLAAAQMTPVCVELGGKSPQVVFADANLDAAAATIIRSLVYYAGQTCTAGTRVLVERAVHGDLVEALESRLRSARVGPAIEDPEVGPLITSKQKESVLAAIEEGGRSGRLVAGGTSAADPDLSAGYFVAPTLFDDVDPRSRIAREEIFGPVLVVSEFEGEAQAIELANDSEFGLAAGVWTDSLGRAHRVARDIQAGQVFVNNYRGGIEIPFGGYKKSGMGREKGIEGILEYTQIKNVCIAVTP
jgi:aldehyde dehydrogenase (NAD+)